MRLKLCKEVKEIIAFHSTSTTYSFLFHSSLRMINCMPPVHSSFPLRVPFASKCVLCCYVSAMWGVCSCPVRLLLQNRGSCFAHTWQFTLIHCGVWLALNFYIHVSKFSLFCYLLCYAIFVVLFYLLFLSLSFVYVCLSSYCSQTVIKYMFCF